MMLARKPIFPSVVASAVLLRPRLVNARDLEKRFKRLNKADRHTELLQLRKKLSQWPAVTEHASIINACTNRSFLSDLSYICIVYDKSRLEMYQRVYIREKMLRFYKDASNDEKKVILAVIDYYGLDA